VLDVADRIIYRVCPFVAAGVVIGSIYWTAVTYGALTVDTSFFRRFKVKIIPYNDNF